MKGAPSVAGKASLGQKKDMATFNAHWQRWEFDDGQTVLISQIRCHPKRCYLPGCRVCAARAATKAKSKVIFEESYSLSARPAEMR